MFHDIIISQIFVKILRNFSGKVPLILQKFPEKFHRKFPNLQPYIQRFDNRSSHVVMGAAAPPILYFAPPKI